MAGKLKKITEAARDNMLPTFTGVMKKWAFVAPEIKWWLRAQAIADNYSEPMSGMFGAIKPEKYLAIGALWGTLESYMLKKTGWHPSVIILCDVDAEMYNKERDSLAYAYKNVTSSKYGDYKGHFIAIRDTSHSEETLNTLFSLGPFDMIYVDGDHIEEGAYADICLAYDLLAPGGIMLVHDLDLPEDDVRNAYNRFIKENTGIKHAEIRDPEVKFGIGIIERQENDKPLSA